MKYNISPGMNDTRISAHRHRLANRPLTYYESYKLYSRRPNISDTIEEWSDKLLDARVVFGSGFVFLAPLNFTVVLIEYWI